MLFVNRLPVLLTLKFVPVIWLPVPFGVIVNALALVVLGVIEVVLNVALPAAVMLALGKVKAPSAPIVASDALDDRQSCKTAPCDACPTTRKAVLDELVGVKVFCPRKLLSPVKRLFAVPLVTFPAAKSLTWLFVIDPLMLTAVPELVA